MALIDENRRELYAYLSNSKNAWYRSSGYRLNNVAPSLIYEFDNKRFWTSTSGATNFPSSSVRTTNATQFDASGNLVWAPHNLTPNSEAVGAVTPTTQPTNWGGGLGTANGITTNIVGVGVEDGMNYIDLRWFGTSGGATSYPGTQFNASTSFNTARLGESYTMSLFVKKIAGSFIGDQAVLQVFEGNPGYLVGSSTALTNANISTTQFNRISVTRTLSNALTTHVSANIQFTITPSDVVDLTLRIARPQLERTSLGSPRPYVPSLLASQFYGARFDYDPTTLASRGVLIEGAGTNFQTLSSSNTPADWNTTNFVTAASGGTQWGFPVIDLVTTSTVNQTFGYVSSSALSAISGNTYSISAFVKKGNHRYVQLTTSSNYNPGTWLNYDFDTNTFTENGAGLIANTGNAEVLNNGWVRLQVAFTANLTTSGASVIIGFPNSLADGRLPICSTASASVLTFGHQAENGVIATSHIPTYGVAATRGGDSFAISTGSWLPSGLGTLMLGFSLPKYTPLRYPVIAEIDDTGGTNFVQIYAASTASNFQFGMRVDDAGATQVNTSTASTSAYYTNTKVALSYALNNTRMCGNAGAVITDSTCTIPATPPLDTLRIGRTTAATSVIRWVTEVRFYPTSSASDAQLQALTTP